MKNNVSSSVRQSELICDECGNRKRFIEIMDVETHLVGGNLNYLHLLDAVVDHYLCAECGETVEVQTVSKE